MGEILVQCEKVLHFDDNIYTKRSFTTRSKPTSSALPEFHLNFHLFCKAYISNWVLTEESSDPQLVERRRSPTMKKLVRLNLEQFLSKKNACEILDNEIIRWPVWPGGRRIFIDSALEKAWEKMESMPLSHNVVNLYLGIIPKYKYIYDQVGVIRDAINRLMEAGDGMVPALEASIESLEHVTLTESGSCPICLEEFVNASENISMRCSHIFHGECIKKWLNTSHYCPLCRFEMPTQ